MANNYVDLRCLRISGSSIDSVDNIEIDDTHAWYWGHMTKAEVNEQLQDQPDGSFLVRDGSEPGYYTLTVKKGGVNKLVKIYCRNNMYGFSEPFAFHSLEDLICYFQTNSLSTHNTKLDIKLLYPVERAKRDSYGDETNEAKKKRDYRELIESLRIEETKLEVLYLKQSVYQEELQTKEKLADNLAETLSIYEQQVELHRQFHGQVSALDIQSLSDNYNALIARVEEICDMREEVAQDIGGITRKNRKIIGEIAELKPVIRKLARLKTKKKRCLVDYNILPHVVEDTWNIGLCDRQDAIAMLEDRERGTFLVRKSEKDGVASYALSMVEQKIVHIKILKKDTGFGIADGYCEHPTLMDLVLHYEETPMSEHNSAIRHTLSEQKIVHIKILKKDTGFGIADGYCEHPTLMDLVLHYEETPMSEHNSAIRHTLRYPVRRAEIDDYYESEPIYGL